MDLAAFKQSPTALFRDYLSDSDRIVDFFGGRWDEATVSKRADDALRIERPLATLASALVRQQRDRSAPESEAAAARLALPGTAVIATGQQACLFGGPLYVAYKAAAAVKVAKRIEESLGRPVVPVFWVASDDHDFAEIRSVSVLDEQGQIRTVRYSPLLEPAGQPSSRIRLDETIAATLADLADALPKSVHRDALLERLATFYAPGETMASAFARLLSFLFPGLVVLDPSDPALKALMAPVLRRELVEASPTSRFAREVGERLRAKGYHQQFPVRDGFLNLFVYADGARRSLASANGSVEIRGVGRRLSKEDAVTLLDKDPGAWSPGALLRPLAQDLILPTIAYVGGPAEIAYHAQIGPSYAHFAIPRPVLVPRPSLTLVEPVTARTLEAEALQMTDLQADLDGLLSRWTKESYPEVEAAFARAREGLTREMKDVESVLGALDPTLRAAADAALGRALHPINTLHEKATRVLKKRDQSRSERIRRTRDVLFPGGMLQERGLGFVSFVARHGEALLGEIVERMDPWARGHQVMEL